MDLTKEDWSEWKGHPCTKAMVDIVKDAILEAKDQERGRLTAEETIRNAHRVDGWCEGAGEILNIIEEQIEDA